MSYIVWRCGIMLPHLHTIYNNIVLLLILGPPPILLLILGGPPHTVELVGALSMRLIPTLI